ncbi:hypothetical protein BGX26_007762 [Mortierella sp. AD094]|nr:hypothetical protein BGX26_007762 [Mortierella sp. AD094]
MSVSRGLQGVGAGFKIPSALALLTTTYPPGPERTFALSIFGGAGCVGQTIGVLLGGVFDATIGWYWIFYLSAILSASLSIGGFFIISKANDNPASADRRIDFGGVLLFMLGIIAVVYYLSESNTSGWGSAKTLAPFLGATDLLPNHASPYLAIPTIVPGSTYWHFAFPALVVNCIGLSPTWMCCQVNAVADASDEDQGVVGAVFNVTLQFGGPLGLAISTIVSESYQGVDVTPVVLMDGYRAAFYTFGVFGAVGFVVTAIIASNHDPVEFSGVPLQPTAEDQKKGISVIESIGASALEGDKTEIVEDKLETVHSPGI